MRQTVIGGARQPGLPAIPWHWNCGEAARASQLVDAPCQLLALVHATLDSVFWQAALGPWFPGFRGLRI